MTRVRKGNTPEPNPTTTSQRIERGPGCSAARAARIHTPGQGDPHTDLSSYRANTMTIFLECQLFIGVHWGKQAAHHLQTMSSGTAYTDKEKETTRTVGYWVYVHILLLGAQGPNYPKWVHRSSLKNATCPITISLIKMEKKIIKFSCYNFQIIWNRGELK